MNEIIYTLMRWSGTYDFASTDTIRRAIRAAERMRAAGMQCHEVVPDANGGIVMVGTFDDEMHCVYIYPLPHEDTEYWIVRHNQVVFRKTLSRVLEIMNGENVSFGDVAFCSKLLSRAGRADDASPASADSNATVSGLSDAASATDTSD